MEFPGLVVTQDLTPFITFGNCFLSPEVSMSPICHVGGSTLAMESPDEPPEMGSAAQTSLEGPRADWQSSRQDWEQSG